jgi:hypothetical protein
MPDRITWSTIISYRVQVPSTKYSPSSYRYTIGLINTTTRTQRRILEDLNNIYDLET